MPLPYWSHQAATTAWGRWRRRTSQGWGWLSTLGLSEERVSLGLAV